MTRRPASPEEIFAQAAEKEGPRPPTPEPTPEPFPFETPEMFFARLEQQQGGGCDD